MAAALRREKPITRWRGVLLLPDDAREAAFQRESPKKRDRSCAPCVELAIFHVTQPYSRLQLCSHEFAMFIRGG